MLYHLELLNKLQGSHRDFPVPNIRVFLQCSDLIFLVPVYLRPPLVSHQVFSLQVFSLQVVREGARPITIMPLFSGWNSPFKPYFESPCRPPRLPPDVSKYLSVRH